MENVKQAKEEVSVLYSFKFVETSFRRHDHKGLLRRHLKKINFIWPYAHEDFFPKDLSQQGILVKSQIPTLEEMMQIEERDENKKVASKKKIAITKQDSSPSTSWVSLYDIDSENEKLDDTSSQTPSLIKEACWAHEPGEEINSKQAIVTNPSEIHCSSNVEIPVAEGPSSYNIEELFGSFTFNLHRKKVRRKKFQKVKERYGQVRPINEDEFLFEKTKEDLIPIDTTYATLTHANVHNMSILHEKLVELELKIRNLRKRTLN